MAEGIQQAGKTCAPGATWSGVTIDSILHAVEAETGCKVTPETKIEDVVKDSLELLDLVLQLGIPNHAMHRMNTVNDLYLAATGKL